jgi:SAM-dependent methyltransferase
MAERTREPQYQVCLDIRDTKGLARFGLMSNQVWEEDPKRLTFLLSRYKFVAKMFSGMKSVLEVGCADAFGTRVVLQEVEDLTAVDFDPVFIEDARQRMDGQWKFNCQVHDMLEGPVKQQSFAGAYSLDVLEHIPREHEQQFVSNIVQSLTEHGVLIIGMPSIESQAYASAPSKEGHVNCKNYRELRDLMESFFHNVFVFSMNDEVVHTGFYPMAHYLLALGCGKKR